MPKTKQERASGEAERENQKDPRAVETGEGDGEKKQGDPGGSNGNGVAVGEVEEDFPKPYSLDVTPEMQKFIAKKLSKALDKMIDEVMADDSSLDRRKKKKESKSGIFLCSSSESVISARDISQSQESSTNKTIRKKPQLLRKRHLEGNGFDDGDDEAKFRSVAVSS